MKKKTWDRQSSQNLCSETLRIRITPRHGLSRFSTNAIETDEVQAFLFDDESTCLLA